MKTGAEQISIERKRQIDVEKYIVEKDVESYGNGQLMGAAGCYLSSAFNKLTNSPKGVRFQVMNPIGVYTDAWPWDDKYDKRDKHDAVRQLVIAGALIAAEIDRLQS